MSEKKPDELVKTSQTPSKASLRRLWKLAGAIVGAGALLAALAVGYAYAVTPSVIREPAFQHYHFRMQVLVNGKAENFGEQKYQADYPKGNCNADLPVQPIHFHDGKDQMTHVHWDGMTGGLLLKYYGWDYIGGLKGALGYRFDDLPTPEKVPVHGTVLPVVPDDATFYVYTGDEHSYQERSFDEFLHKDLEDFFGKQSNLPGNAGQSTRSTPLDKLFPKAYAHGSEVHDAVTSDHETSQTDQETLTRLNNLIGNVVIFVQKDKPGDQQIKERFSRLAPLERSTCGG